MLARRGQGLFRENVERLEKECRLTGVTNRMLLIASHIKPWRSCLTAQERLDGNNGLLLTPDADFLFDRGFISFDDSGRPILSSRLCRADLCRMGLGRFADGFQPANDLIGGERPASFRTEQKGYLSYHRSNVFLG
nr:HNH endonuclease signature motif containing protein [Rhizobium leguminosarum]